MPIELSGGELVNFGPIRRDELPGLYLLEQATFGWEGWDKEALDEEFYSNPSAFFGARTKRLVGYIYKQVHEIATPNGTQMVAEIGSIAVAKRLRKKDLGFLLMGYGLRDLRQLNLPIVLHTKVDNIPMQRLATSAGFEITALKPNFYKDSDAYLFEFISSGSQA